MGKKTVPSICNATNIVGNKNKSICSRNRGNKGNDNRDVNGDSNEGSDRDNNGKNDGNINKAGNNEINNDKITNFRSKRRNENIHLGNNKSQNLKIKDNKGRVNKHVNEINVNTTVKEKENSTREEDRYGNINNEGDKEEKILIKGKRKRPRDNEELEILFYNCRGLANEERLCEMENAIEKVRWDIIGLSEVRRKGEGLIKRRNGNYFYYFGETKGYRGIGFYIKNKIWNKVIEIGNVSERIGVLKIRSDKHVIMTIIQIYAPTAEKDDNEMERFYSALETTIDQNKEYYTIIMGDWNSKLGKNNLVRGILGPYGIGKKNVRGEKLIQFAASNNLKIAGTFFKKKERNRWTWESPDGKSRNEIDHILINDLTIIKDVTTLKKFEFSSDHRVGRATLKIPKRVKILNSLKCKKLKDKIIPLHKIQEVTKCITEKINSEIIETEEQGVQELYDRLEKK